MFLLRLEHFVIICCFLIHCHLLNILSIKVIYKLLFLFHLLDVFTKIKLQTLHMLLNIAVLLYN